MSISDYADFVEAMRLQKIVKMATQFSKSFGPIQLERSYSKYNWAMPSFEFGYAFDPGHPSFVGHSICNDLWIEASNLLASNEMRMPFPECAFLFRYRETLGNSETVNLIHLLDDGDEIEGNIYFQQPAQKMPYNLWTRSPLQFVLQPGFGCEINYDPSVPLTSKEEEAFRMDIRTKYSEVLYAALLLRSRHSSINDEEVGQHKFTILNRARVDKGKLEPLPFTRLIRIDVEQLASTLTNTSAGLGSSKRPHERRGHYRTLRNGRDIWVKSCKIKGGTIYPPAYEVKT